ncbi:MAG: hypothetical protein DLM53_07105 [Candidatus Eremiobacter antarcticus]|nr:M56 family metallopeptidase [Candidatus Eremiobacteraeota bacterium]MBC5808754.1 M56 family metallopeptidase [Candidatus Eremiobacteraeota bacterium]PZR62226.1 MAG: hypothetical protein DLM53_07105 [Candidatus Eremiobacter sp. RRmetagenome_bin22]
MHDVIEFFAQCAQSGTLLTSLCALVLLPLAAWVACRLLTPHIVAMTDDPSWQAPLSALAAGLPGALFVGLSVRALFSDASLACLSVPVGRGIFSLIIAIMTAALIRALWLASQRARQVGRLIRCSAEPSQRLQGIASACGVVSREISDSAPVCILAGTSSPVVLVSAGALAAVSDEQLRAALQHESAHARRGDQLLAAALYFLTDLLPLPAHELIETYRVARELAADSDAASSTDAGDLAGALLQFSKAGQALAAVSSLADQDTVAMTKRLVALLAPSQHRGRTNTVRRVALASALAFIALTVFFIPVMSAQHAPSCTLVMKAGQ